MTLAVILIFINISIVLIRYWCINCATFTQARDTFDDYSFELESDLLEPNTEASWDTGIYLRWTDECFLILHLLNSSRPLILRNLLLDVQAHLSCPLSHPKFHCWSELLNPTLLLLRLALMLLRFKWWMTQRWKSGQNFATAVSITAILFSIRVNILICLFRECTLLLMGGF